MSASAATLVSNIGQTRAVNNITTTGILPAQGFTISSNSAGYTLTGIEAALDGSTNAAQRATVRAELWSAAAGGAPDSKIADLTVPSSVSAGTVSFAAPANTTLQAGTTYYFLLYTTGTFDLRLDITTSNAEDAGGAPGWSIANHIRFLTMDTPGTGTRSWGTDLNARMAIRVNGIIPPPSSLTLSADRAPREGGGDVTVTATLDRTLSHDVEVNVRLDGTATWGGSISRTRFSTTPDYWTPIPAGAARRHTWFDEGSAQNCVAAGLFLIPAGQIAASFTIRVIDDTHPDAGETIAIRASLQRDDGPNVYPDYLGLSAALTLTIANDDTGPETAVRPVVAESVLRYDTNGDGAIDHAEYGRAARDYADGKIAYGYLLPVVEAYRAWKDGAGGDTGGGDGPSGDNPVGNSPVGNSPVGNSPVGGDPGGDVPGSDRSSGTGGSSGAGAGPASATPGTAALSTRIVGRRARSINSPYCFVPGADELDTLGESARLAYRLDSGKDFDLCLWAPDPNWRTAPAYASCRGAGGALPKYASLLEGPGREELSVERAPELMACVVPAGTASGGGAWQLRISPDNPEPENPE